jgi:hypothetical protein
VQIKQHHSILPFDLVNIQMFKFKFKLKMNTNFCHSRQTAIYQQILAGVLVSNSLFHVHYSAERHYRSVLVPSMSNLMLC